MPFLRDCWIRLSIEEISTQCRFALISWANLDTKATISNDTAFSSAHSFLSHAANISKLLSAKDINDSGLGDVIGNELQIPTTSIIHDRRLRNNLEHYDERLKEWLKAKGYMANIGTYNIGPKKAITGSDFIFVTHYDDLAKIFTFVDEDFNLEEIAKEIKKIQAQADDRRTKRPNFLIDSKTL